MAKEKIIGLMPGYNGSPPQYVAIEAGMEHYGFSIHGSTGELVREKALDDIHEEWRESIDVEEEYGYMADESGVPDDERKDWLERILDSMEWPEPIEINYDIQPVDVDGEEYYATFQSAGQVMNSVEKINAPLIPMQDIDFIMKTWKKYHMKKEVPKTVVDRMRKIMDGIDNEKQVRAAFAMGTVPKGMRQTSVTSGPGAGWHYESARHGLAAKGIKTGRKR
jgi:hypothetical protein